MIRKFLFSALLILALSGTALLGDSILWKSGTRVEGIYIRRETNPVIFIPFKQVAEIPMAGVVSIEAVRREVEPPRVHAGRIKMDRFIYDSREFRTEDAERIRVEATTLRSSSENQKIGRADLVNLDCAR